jgi:hypothetical protein
MIAGVAVGVGRLPPAAAQPTATAPAATVPAATLPVAPGPRPTGISEEQVTQAIRRGVDYLLSVKKNDNWEAREYFDFETGGMKPMDNTTLYYGTSCVVLYSLLHVGQSLDDPRLKPRADELAGAVKYLMAMEPTTVYAASLQLNALALLPRRDDVVKLMERRRDQLVNATHRDGGHSYCLDLRRKNFTFGMFSDGSNSQYALLALWTASDADLPVVPAYWSAAEKFWRGRVRPDGGFAYRDQDGSKEGESSLTMTAAAVSSLLITGEHTNLAVTTQPKSDPQVDAAMNYLAANFKPNELGGYALYGVERVGLASGRKFLGRTNWFAEGAASLISRQNKDGSWILKEHGTFENAKISTAFALLFLARGRNPVVFNKLEYAAVDGGGWNARPRDSTNLTNWMSHQFERPINWQVVNIDNSPDEWLDAPVLLITGAKDPGFTLEQIDHLRRYVRAGGLVFSSADAGSAQFTTAMRRYAEAVVDSKFPWRDLPDDHEVYQVYQKMPTDKPPLMGVSNGVRELWIHSPKDLGAAWQAKVMATVADRAQGKVEKDRPWEIAANVFFYANGRSMRSKLQSTAVADATGKPTRTVRIGRLEYKGNWDPEPGAFERLSRMAAARWHTDLQFAKVDFKHLADVPIIYMSGVGRPEWTVEQRWAMRDYLNDGGILLCDALNSSKEFDAWFQQMVKDTFFEDRWDLLDDRAVLFNPTMPDMVAIQETALRAAAQKQFGEQSKPKVYALISRKNPRVRILYTPFDLTLGYLGTTTAGFTGYTPESAELLARNMILYSQAVVASTPKTRPAATAPGK